MTTLPRMLDFSVRLLVFIAALIILSAIVVAGARQALAATLKPAGVITGSMLTLGDIFDGLSYDKASHILGPAPQPGGEMVLNARTLMRIALAMDLSWQPVSSSDQIILRRAATKVTTDIIEEALMQKIGESGVEGNYSIRFAGLAPELVLPGEQPAMVDVAAFTFDPHRDTFTATVVAPSKSAPAAQAEVSGQIERVVAVPALSQNLKNGDIIGPRDISWVEIPVRGLQPDLVMKEEDILGMTPRRIAMAGKPLRTADIVSPRLVSRGDDVTIVYESGPLVLTAGGRALQDGGKGDMVRVVNDKSNLQVDAFVSGARQVHVKP